MRNVISITLLLILLILLLLAIGQNDGARVTDLDSCSPDFDVQDLLRTTLATWSTEERPSCKPPAGRDVFPTTPLRANRHFAERYALYCSYGEPFEKSLSHILFRARDDCCSTALEASSDPETSTTKDSRMAVARRDKKVRPVQAGTRPAKIPSRPSAPPPTTTITTTPEPPPPSYYDHSPEEHDDDVVDGDDEDAKAFQEKDDERVPRSSQNSAAPCNEINAKLVVVVVGCVVLLTVSVVGNVFLIMSVTRTCLCCLRRRPRRQGGLGMSNGATTSNTTNPPHTPPNNTNNDDSQDGSSVRPEDSVQRGPSTSQTRAVDDEYKEVYFTPSSPDVRESRFQFKIPSFSLRSPIVVTPRNNNNINNGQATPLTNLTKARLESEDDEYARLQLLIDASRTRMSQLKGKKNLHSGGSQENRYTEWS